MPNGENFSKIPSQQNSLESEKKILEALFDLDKERIAARKKSYQGLVEAVLQNPIHDLDFDHVDEIVTFNTPERLTENKDDTLKATISEGLQNRDVLDLGGGPQGYMSRWARSWGANNYINVDLSFSENGEIRPEVPVNKQRSLKRPDGGEFLKVLVGSDMLSFLSHVKDEAPLSIIISGIDDTIIDNTSYVSVVVSELARTVSSGGLVLVNSSPHFADSLSSKDNFEQVGEIPLFRPAQLFRRK